MSDWVQLRDQLNLTLRPIEQWPGKMTPHYLRERGPFSAGLKDTLAVLRKELNALRAKGIVLQIAIRPEKLRLDGLPRAGATAEHPGVILTFESSKGYLRLWFDKFLRWEYNLRAIALHLEHLRLATLYGVGDDGQAYKGWQALPPSGGGTSVEPGLSLEDSAAVLLADRSGYDWSAIRKNEETFRQAYRVAAQRNHPDALGGSENAMQQVNAAAAILKKVFGI